MSAPAAIPPGLVDNRLFVLILQHPRERREALASAAVLPALLGRAALVAGLSWPNLAAALGRRADARRWAVLYLGTARPRTVGGEREIVVLDRNGEPAPETDALLRGLEGVVLLDGSWKEAKTLWWRNPWLLKLHRLVLNPLQPSRYGRLRREPRREALSTLEAAALLLRHCERTPDASAALLAEFDRLLAGHRASAEREETA
ncbi:MAG: DTW domain-containing protein [Alphaproteobacteria bacterium]|nr:DTW domain-containing protein [Alphaproteobacteria bacterium]